MYVASMETVLVRHGIAVDRADPAYPNDVDRPLTIDGKHKAEAAVRGLRALVGRPELVLTSPYLRCQQTARIVLEVFGLPKQALVATDALIPEAPPAAIWSELALVPRERVVIIGHGGSLEPIAAHALGPWPAPALHLKKAGAMCLAVTLEPVLSAQLEWLVTPKILRQLAR
jgi:phosphohistidine phosphatase